MTKPAAATDLFANLFARFARDARRPKVDATDDLANRLSYDEAWRVAVEQGLAYSPRWHRITLSSQPVLGYTTGWRS